MTRIQPQANSPTRTDRKQETRQRILAAALRLVEEGRPPDALGLREVAREAGMAAPSLYNHFANMDELGLALVDECLLRLRTIARAARKEMSQAKTEQVLHVLLRQFLQYMNKYEAVLRLLILQWFNPNPEFRKTIRRELAIIQDDLAGNMRQAASGKGLPAADFEVESEAILSLLITYILDALNLPKKERAQRLERVEKQLLMLVAGSRALSGAAGQ